MLPAASVPFHASAFPSFFVGPDGVPVPAYVGAMPPAASAPLPYQNFGSFDVSAYAMGSQAPYAVDGALTFPGGPYDFPSGGCGGGCNTYATPSSNYVRPRLLGASALAPSTYPVGYSSRLGASYGGGCGSAAPTLSPCASPCAPGPRIRRVCRPRNPCAVSACGTGTCARRCMADLKRGWGGDTVSHVRGPAPCPSDPGAVVPYRSGGLGSGGVAFGDYAPRAGVYSGMNTYDSSMDLPYGSSYGAAGGYISGLRAGAYSSELGLSGYRSGLQKNGSGLAYPSAVRADAGSYSGLGGYPTASLGGYGGVGGYTRKSLNSYSGFGGYPTVPLDSYNGLGGYSTGAFGSYGDFDGYPTASLGGYGRLGGYSTGTLGDYNGLGGYSTGTFGGYRGLGGYSSASFAEYDGLSGYSTGPLGGYGGLGGYSTGYGGLGGYRARSLGGYGGSAGYSSTPLGGSAIPRGLYGGNLKYARFI